MVQGGLHRGVAVSEGFRVSLWPSPPQGLSFPPCTPLAPMHSACSAQVHHGLGDRAFGHGGYRSLRGARSGPRELGDGGVKGRRRWGGGKGRRLPLHCSLRRGNGTCLQLRQSDSP